MHINAQTNLMPFLCNTCTEWCNADPSRTFLHNSLAAILTHRRIDIEQNLSECTKEFGALLQQLCRRVNCRAIQHLLHNALSTEIRRTYGLGRKQNVHRRTRGFGALHLQQLCRRVQWRAIRHLSTEFFCVQKSDVQMDWGENTMHIDGQKNLAPFFRNYCAEACNAEPPSTFLQNSFVYRN